MNRRIGIYSSIITLISVILFAISMVIRNDILSYISSIFIAIGFVQLICAYKSYNNKNNSSFGNIALAFSICYIILVLLVYFAQLTTVRFALLTETANYILNYKKYGLFFNYDLLGYAFMALSTFFIAFTIEEICKSDRFLKIMLKVHGIFFPACFIMPMLNIFNSNMQGSEITGIIILEFWCVYFIPICIMSIQHFINIDKLKEE